MSTEISIALVSCFGIKWALNPNQYRLFDSGVESVLSCDIVHKIDVSNV